MLRRRTPPDGGHGRWLDGNLAYTTHMGHNEPAYDANNPIFRGGQPIEEHEYLTDALTREAIDFIDRHQRKPFFLYLAYNAVHSPLQGTDAYVQRFGHIENLQRRIFAAMLSNLDDSVGAVLAKLHETNLQKRTLVFFLSDNGGPTRELTSSNLPLRGAKGDVYEGGIRVPFMLQWKGQLPEGQVYDQPVISLDIFATAAVAAGAPLPTNRSIDGVDLMPYLTGKKSGRPHEVLFWRMGQRTAVRVGNWKLLRNRRRGQSQWYLYNLADDLAEQNDRALRDADKLACLGTAQRANGQIGLATGKK